ncbi:MAG TPA: hypothetical protein VIR61_01770 [Sulfuricaulis sp.]
MQHLNPKKQAGGLLTAKLLRRHMSFRSADLEYQGHALHLNRLAAAITGNIKEVLIIEPASKPKKAVRINAFA